MITVYSTKLKTFAAILSPTNIINNAYYTL